MKHSQKIGIAAIVVLLGACFLPWAFYPDLNKAFTGFFSEGNSYGRPGRTFVVLGIVAIVFFLLPKVWAKRWNLLIAALILSYAIKSFILFSGCYHGICPQKKIGIWLMLIASIVTMLMAVFPDTNLSGSQKKKSA